MNIVVVASLSFSLINFRGPLLKALVDAGHDVTACAPDEDDAVASQLSALGVAWRRIPMDRAGLNPLSDLSTLRHLVALFRKERPDIVLAYTQKPIIYAGLAARLAGGTRYFAMCSGLGHAFSPGGGRRRRALRAIVARLLRMAMRRAEAIFVFNADDRPDMLRYGIVDPAQRVVQLPGSGIDTSRYAPQPLPSGPPTFMMISRLMRDKGIAEFAAAAALVRQRYPDARFHLLGPLDPNPSGISQAELDRWIADGSIDYLGATRDVRPYLAAASVFVLPSYYREGLPRTILEAMAVGRAIVTTDMPGCREPVEAGHNGLLVPPRDAGALADALLSLLDQPDRIAAMGQASRALAVERYAVDKVNAQILDTMTLPGPHPAGPDGSVDRARIVERLVALMLLVVTLPLTLALAVMVGAAMGRPVFFIQSRAGANGRPFPMIKFRTMREAHDAAGRPLPDDRRVTALGRWLRRSRLDELPGLWNIVRGDMRFIGPRPLLPQTIAAMGQGGAARGRVCPGLTGWAQVNGNALLSDREKLALDLWYVTHRSPALDLRILLKTAGVVTLGERRNPLQIDKADACVADRGR